ncbi:hypothetical protein GCM10022254_05920 [Actinomadura meridiana]|uniref:Protein-L-isoaspartate O-methyltransferase n=2 Tax=Actinomadura meridiana TaxID=559626 RepID=A0ABP8BST1_9ACTN
MIAEVQASGSRTTRVLDAMAAVRREPFLPDANLEEVYDPHKAVVIKRDDGGAIGSCSSVPTLVATMLDQLRPQLGHNVLEIAAGTGINAAYLRELVGPTGSVTTIDHDPGVTAHARAALHAAGYPDVEVITRDGALGDQAHGPYHGIIVTVGAPDVYPAWREQLLPRGRLLVPLRFRGTTRSLGLTLEGDTFISDTAELCGFIPMIGHDGERTAAIDPDGLVSLYWDPDQDIDPGGLADVLVQPRTEAWSGEFVGNEEPFDGVWLRLAATEPGTCRITAAQAASELGLCTPGILSRSPAIAEGSSLAYFALRRMPHHPDGPRSELGAIGHGPKGAQLAHRFRDQICAWGANRTITPTITIYLAGTPAAKIPSRLIIDKPNTRISISY